MSWKGRIGGLVAVALVGVVAGVLVLVVPATAARKRAAITGTLSRPGYTVIALAANGAARSVVAKHGSFSVRPPASTVTLQLRAPDGLYAGPVAVASEQRGKQVIEGVRVGASLGKININASKGYARVAKKLPARWLDASRWARARRGVPIGNGHNFGFVRSKPPRHPPPGDLDADGVPDVLDVDLNGNLVLNDLDRSTAARAHAAGAVNGFQFHSVLPLPPEDVVNANAATLTTEEIDTALSSWGYLAIGVVQPGAELDCGGAIQQPARPQGLVYCSQGGTGRAFGAVCCSRSDWPRFPDDFLDPATGLGKLPQEPNSVFFLSHGARSDQIGTGDLVMQRVTTNGVESDVTATLQYVFDTTPALRSYSDTAGDRATVAYPLSAGKPGTTGNGFPLGAPAGQDVVLTLTSWRPQRQRLLGDPTPTGNESTLWTDIGGLNYTPIVQHIGPPGAGQEVAKGCPQSTLSTTDPNLTPLTPADVAPLNYSGFRDHAPDHPADPANTFSYTLDLTQCLASLGVSWSPGEEIHLTFEGLSPNGGGDAEETVIFRRQ